MNKETAMKQINRLVAATLPLMLVACATPGGESARAGADAAKHVEQRAVKRWELLVAGKAAEAYDYLSPGFREIKAREAYVADLKDRPVQWTAAKFNAIECPPEAGYCDVTIDLHYEMQSPLPGVGKLASHSPVIERWISTDGSWYFVPKEVARK